MHNLGGRSIYVIALGFLGGVISLHQLSSLPPVWLVGFLPVLAILLIRYPILRFWIALGCGFLWALYQAQGRLAVSLERHWEGRDLRVQGTVVSIPKVQDSVTRFVFEIHDLVDQGDAIRGLPIKVRLAWYSEAPRVKLGESWHLTVRLKRPWGFQNPGGFDYEGWLFQRGIRATGYVRGTDSNGRLPVERFSWGLGPLRQELAASIDRILHDDPNRGVIKALAIGSRSDIEPALWDRLLVTGTNHLLAISGLHIGLVSGLVFWGVRRGWRFSARLCTLWPASKAAALGALGAGSFYALLAGFTVPTQRALIMLAVAMVAVLLDRPIRPLSTLALALLAVLIWDPLSILAAGFWLSFGAVAILLYTVTREPRSRPAWWNLGRIQWIVVLGTMPLTLLFFDRISLVAPLANLLAVPWVGGLIVPVVLLGVLLLIVAPALGAALLKIASAQLNVLWWALAPLSEHALAQWHHVPPGWTLVPMTLGVMWLLAPRGWPARWLGIPLMAPALLVAPQHVPDGGFRFTLLDVGQGLATVVQTHKHTLVFDTGGRFSAQFDAGKAVIVPYLVTRGIERVDTLIVSHGDNDHAGGAQSLVARVPVDRVLTSEPLELPLSGAEQCEKGTGWDWDGVRFDILHPPPWGWDGAENNRSCVIRVSNAAASVLLAADIEASAEDYLVESMAEKLRSDVLVVPHHGSATSSTPEFLRNVGPRLAVVSTGYRNRFGFPRPEVMARYESQGIPVLDTAEQGAISLNAHPLSGMQVEQGYRRRAARYWTTLP